MYLPVLVMPLLQLLLIFGLGQYLNLTTHAAALPVTTDSFGPEGDVWHNIPEFDLLACNITVPGISPLYPDVHCTSDGSICQLVTGEAEINAATTVTALVFSNLFNLATTYFLIAGIAGINPKVASIGDVTFAKYAVQVALQYEFDSREKPENFPTGYVPLGATAPGQFPGNIYGTEVFQLNSQLRDIAVGLAKNATLLDSPAAQELRSLYGQNAAFAAASSSAPSVVECDTATADAYFTGELLDDAFDNFTSLLTNGAGVYCTSQQEDNGTLEALLRAAQAKKADFSRIILMRTASDFDRPYQGQSAADNLFGDTPGFEPALSNIYLAGVKVVGGIVNSWQQTFEQGVQPTTYIGDILGSLGGTPDFASGST
ncbi:hypothetical protein D9757_012616 [Collybiopsis confluens]|uniref:Purine nucleoside permease n=1 Tax=Collybiopsis confluens TaxID=2823264 RepID=A0A8H5LPY3_9AGAR|nr:hypothetical protein D9757_012616 [Collybiopsis confluens]